MKRPNPWKNDPKLVSALRNAEANVREREATEVEEAARRHEIEAQERDHADQLPGFLRWQEQQHQLARDRERLNSDDMDPEFLADLDAASARFSRELSGGVSKWKPPKDRPRRHHSRTFARS